MAAQKSPESESRLEAMLDQALEATFPASDPLAIIQPHDHEDEPEPPLRP